MASNIEVKMFRLQIQNFVLNELRSGRNLFLSSFVLCLSSKLSKKEQPVRLIEGVTPINLGYEN